MTKYVPGGVVDPQIGSPDDADSATLDKIKADPIPAEWHANSKVEFEVPAGGTDRAVFDIVSGK